MVTEQLIHQNKAHHRELLHEAARSRVLNDMNITSPLGEAMARTGDFLVAIGHGLQQRFRRVENGVALSRYNGNQRLGQSL